MYIVINTLHQFVCIGARKGKWMLARSVVHYGNQGDAEIYVSAL